MNSLAIVLLAASASCALAQDTSGSSAPSLTIPVAPAGASTPTGVPHVGGSVTPPRVLHSVNPAYTEEARKAKFSGNVKVYLVVDENGNPTHLRVVKSVGMGLDERAVEAVRQYKFKPATRDGKPVEVDLYIDVNFSDN